MEATLYICGLILILVGYIAARIEFNKKLHATRIRIYDIGFGDGFDDALKDAGAVRRAYQYHFHARP
jgi:hypothetical protein